MKADHAKIKVDWASEQERMELEVAKADREAVEAVEKHKASESFAVEKAQAVVDFQKLKEFYAFYRDFGLESYKEGFNKESLSVG